MISDVGGDFMGAVPHLVQYQGSKRAIAPIIIEYFPPDINRLIEPFAGTCAVSILAAYKKIANKFLLNDINKPLSEMMKLCVEDPEKLSIEYDGIWRGQFEKGQDNINYFFQIREQFNDGENNEARMLFLLSRVVKGAIRYNSQGKMNQSCDKRRYGTKPKTVRDNAYAISELLKGRTQFMSCDYKQILELAQEGDLVYMDPPYQGTSNPSNKGDRRYLQGVDFDEFVCELEKLNERKIDYIISYDGLIGDKKVGNDLPNFLDLTHLHINAGLSAQSVLNGRKEKTTESLYLSSGLKSRYKNILEQLTFQLT